MLIQNGPGIRSCESLPTAYWGEAHRSLLLALRAEQQEPIPKGLRLGGAAAGGIPFYLSDLEPRVTGGRSPGLPATIAGLSTAVGEATTKYEGRIPPDPWQLPPEEPGAEGYAIFKGGKRGVLAYVRPQAWMDERREAEPAGAAAAAGEGAEMPAAEVGFAQNEFPVGLDDEFCFEPDDVVPAQELADEEWDPDDDGEMEQQWADAC
eukprot:gene52049-41198_t